MISRSYIKRFADHPNAECRSDSSLSPPRAGEGWGEGGILSAAKNLLFALLCLVLLAGPALADETVNISAPMSLTFYVLDVGSITYADDNPTTISFSDANLTAGYSLRISIKAESSGFTSPCGSDIPASNVSWTTSGAVGGSGSNGQLSSVTYTQVFQSSANPTSGSVDVSWTLSAPGADICAGNHTLIIRWKIESVAP